MGRSAKDGQAHQEGRHHGQVRNALWRLLAQDRQKVRDFAARSLSLHLLWQRLRHPRRCRDLEMPGQELRKGSGGWRLADHDGSRRHGEVHHQPLAQDYGRGRQVRWTWILRFWEWLEEWLR